MKHMYMLPLATGISERMFNVRQRKRGVTKQPGCTWIDVSGLISEPGHILDALVSSMDFLDHFPDYLHPADKSLQGELLLTEKEQKTPPPVSVVTNSTIDSSRTQDIARIWTPINSSNMVKDTITFDTKEEVRGSGLSRGWTLVRQQCVHGLRKSKIKMGKCCS